jgi:hypothetical protein
MTRRPRIVRPHDRDRGGISRLQRRNLIDTGQAAQQDLASPEAERRASPEVKRGASPEANRRPSPEARRLSPGVKRSSPGVKRSSPEVKRAACPAEQLGVPVPGRDQRLVVALLEYPSLIQHADVIGAPHPPRSGPG